MTKGHIILLQIWATVSFVFGFYGMSYASSCNDQVRELTDLSRRGPSYQIKSPSEPIISDSTLQAGWYVAKDDIQYYTILNGTAPNYAFCGTDNPIYIKDEVEELDEGKEYQFVACLVDFDSSCKHRYNVTIRRCGQIFHYYLLPSDGTSAYCFESSLLTAEAAPPNYEISGNIIVSVALMYRRGNLSSEPELDFKCNFESARNRYYYGVSWIINKRVEKTFTPVTKTYIDSTNLDETTLRNLGFGFGITIQCAVRVSITVSGSQTSPQMSDTFYAGIKIVTPQVSLSSGSSVSISLQPTVPLGCRRSFALPEGRPESCYVHIEMFDPKSKYTCQETSLTTLSNQKLCGSKMIGWRKSFLHFCIHQHNVSYCSYSQIQKTIMALSMRLTVANDQLQYPIDKTFTMQLKTGQNAPHLFWKNARLDDVTVHYTGGSQNTEWMRKTCSVINDPTLNTFHGSSTYMKSFSHYLLYKNTENLAEIQIKTQSCDADHTSSCTCASAIQAGGDVFVIDVCSTIKRAAFTNCRGNVLNVRELYENTYVIYLPTGTKVSVNIRKWNKATFLKVYVNPSPSDIYKTEGLCGNLTGREDENVDSAYLKKWELKESVFNTVRYNLPSTWTYDHYLCLCPGVAPNATTLREGEKDSRASCFTEQYAVCTDNKSLNGERSLARYGTRDLLKDMKEITKDCLRYR